MSSHSETKCLRKRHLTQPGVRDLSITDPEGAARYFGRPLYFGPFHQDALDELFECRVELELAEECGQLQTALELLGLGSKEQWWHIEASFYQRHLAADVDPAALHRQLCERARLQRRRVRRAEGTPAPSSEPSATPPVSFEVYCELAGAQAAWADRGLDAVNEAVAHFLLEPADLLEADVYWTRRLGEDRELARLFARKMLEYRAQF